MDIRNKPDPLEELKCLAAGDNAMSHELQRIAAAWQDERYEMLSQYKELMMATDRIMVSAGSAEQLVIALCQDFAGKSQPSDEDIKKRPAK